MVLFNKCTFISGDISGHGHTHTLSVCIIFNSTSSNPKSNQNLSCISMSMSTLLYIHTDNLNSLTLKTVLYNSIMTVQS